MSLTPHEVFQEMVQTALETLMSKTNLLEEDVQELANEVIQGWFEEDDD